MTSLVELFLVLIAVATFVVVRQYRRVRREQALRLAPLPPRKVIEVKLPRDVTDANTRMRRFYSRVASVTTGDTQAREEGIGQLDMIYLIDRPPHFLTPILRFFIVADERAMPTVKRALKTAFEQQAEVFNIEVDPLQDVFEQLRQRALAEASHDEEPEQLPSEPKGAQGSVASS
jgi:hypothetical protein